MPDTMHTDNRTPTYTRLGSGAWGVRVPQRFRPLAPGETVCIAVHRRSGEVSSETVRCFWRGVSARTKEVVALCEIVPSNAGALAREGGRDSP